MTALTGQSCVATCQRETAAVVIEINIIPTGWIMTGRTIGTKLTVVIIILLVTGITVGRCTFENIILMTGLTRNFRMLTLQLERR